MDLRINRELIEPVDGAPYGWITGTTGISSQDTVYIQISQITSIIHFHLEGYRFYLSDGRSYYSNFLPPGFFGQNQEEDGQDEEGSD